MESHGIVIRSATREDVAELLTVLPQLTSDPQRPAAAMPSLAEALAIFDRQQQHGNVLVLVATAGADGPIIGSCTLVIVPNFTYGGRPWAIAENVVIVAAYRGRGIGTRLMEYACDLCRHHGCYKLQLISGPKPEQVRFYRDLGFDDQHSRGFKLAIGTP
jgi:GNAT superfamily N-acetyltransferase